MKKIVSIIMSVMIITTLAGCGRSKSAEGTTSPPAEATTEYDDGYDTYDVGDYVSIDVPSEWEWISDDPLTFMLPDGDSAFSVVPVESNLSGAIDLIDSGELSKQDIATLYIDAFLNSLGDNTKSVCVKSNKFSDMLDYPCERISGTSKIGDDTCEMSGYVALYPSGIYMYTINYLPENNYDYSDELQYIVCNTTLYDNSDQPEDDDDFESEEETTEAATTGESNALSKAGSYLYDLGGFSKKRLKEQLKYEGFTDSECDYAIKNCGADWKEQAAQKAQSYMDTSSFSKERLRDQLEYEGFNKKQINYALKQVGY